MCGICGVINKREAIDKDRFEKMIDLVTHRGPDDRGTYYGDGIALGHRRLAIIDLSKEGHQPFAYKDRYVMVYNGEIYNYKELRKELEKKGYCFSTKTDTEVLIAMYDCYGKDCVNRLNGMWAFAIYDKEKNNLFCSRDRFGIKPFYYFYENGELLFCSEIKQILEMWNKQEIYANNQRLLEFLVLGDLDYTDETMFADIMQLRGGHNLSFDMATEKLEIDCYYDISIKKRAKHSYKASCEEFRKLFENSIRYRLRADVPVGYCLSGGLDSSSIVCMADYIIANSKKNIDQYAVSSCFEEKEYDEQEYIDEVIKATAVHSYKVFPDQRELFDELDKNIWHMDEPFGSTSGFAQWNVFKTAKEKGLTVMLDGQGADEQLAGYTGFYSVAFTHYLRKFQLIRFVKEVYSYCKYRVGTEKYVSAADVLINAVVSAFMPNRLKLYLKRKLGYGFKDLPFSKEIIERVVAERTLYQVSDPAKYSVDMMKCNMPALLHCEDRNSMAHSIESRVPFLDYKLAESVYNMPMQHKIRDGVTKAVLRDGLQEILPDKIRKRISKLGFVTPEDKWINENFEVFRSELNEACRILHGLIDEKLVMDWFDRNKGKMQRGNFIAWRIICTGHWMRIFNVSLRQES